MCHYHNKHQTCLNLASINHILNNYCLHYCHHQPFLIYIQASFFLNFILLLLNLWLVSYLSTFNLVSRCFLPKLILDLQCGLNQRTWRQICFIATSSTTSLMWINTDLKLGLFSEKPVFSCKCIAAIPPVSLCEVIVFTLAQQ